MSAWGRFYAWSDRNRLTTDAVTAAAVGMVVLPLSVTSNALWVRTPWAGPTAVVALAMLVPLAWRRTHPVASTAAVYTVALTHMVVLGIPLLLPADLLVAWSLWSVTVHGPRWAVRVAFGGSMAGSALLATLLTSLHWVDRTLLFAMSGLLFATVWSVALSRRARRVALDALADRADRLELTRAQEVELATAAERARIAREMHDIVAHSLSVIIAQADGGRYAAQADPDAAGRALDTISQTGRAALSDMRRLLGVLRTGPADDATPTGPLPAVGDITALVEQLRGSGLRISLVRLGTPRTLPPGVGLTVFRIAQESLTNVLKHAGPDPAVTVVLQWLPRALVLEIDDDGRGAGTDSDGLGQGLLGIRERAAMVGGDVALGPRPGGGFRVRATIPLPAVASDPTPGPFPSSDRFPPTAPIPQTGPVPQTDSVARTEPVQQADPIPSTGLFAPTDMDAPAGTVRWGPAVPVAVRGSSAAQPHPRDEENPR